MIKVGIIGAGLSARIFHLSFLNRLKDNYKVVAISTSNPSKISCFVDNDVRFYATGEEIIEDKEVDLVIIAAHNNVHYHYATLALNNNKHVVVEKPIVESVEEAKVLKKLAEKSKKTLSVYQNRRWDGDFLTVKSILSDKQIGDLKYFESCFDKCVPNVRDRWREKDCVASGFWFDLGSHTVDQVVNLFGLPKSVTGHCLKLRENAQTDDYAHVLFHYPDKEVVLKVNPFVASPMSRFTLHGTKGSYIKQHLDIQEMQLIELGMASDDKQFGEETEDRYGTLYSLGGQQKIPTQKGNYSNFYRQLFHAITDNKPLPVAIDEVIQSLYLLNLAIQSSKQKKTLMVDCCI